MGVLYQLKFKVTLAMWTEFALLHVSTTQCMFSVNWTAFTDALLSAYTVLIVISKLKFHLYLIHSVYDHEFVIAV